MMFNRKAIQSIAVLCVLCLLSITAVTDKGYSDDPCIGSGEEAANDKVVAGAAAQFAEFAWELDQELDYAVTVEKIEIDLLGTTVDETEEEASEEETDGVEEPAESAEAPNPEPEKTQEEKEWENRLMTNVKNYLYVRKGPGTDYAVEGKLLPGDLAVIEEAGPEWTKISSGNVIGYVCNEYCITGLDALAYAKQVCPTVATSTTKALRVRRSPGTDGKIATRLEKGEELPVDLNAEIVDGWIPVTYKKKLCYVSSEFVTVALKTGKALTLKEEAEAIAAEKKRKAEEEARKLEITGSALAASTDEVTLLAAIIQCEVGGEPYECQLAVGAVVVNRVNSRRYPNTVYEVIYQKGQFSPAASGKLARRLKSGVSRTALQAAQEALDGVDNTDGAIGFRLASSGKHGTVYGRVVFFR